MRFVLVFLYLPCGCLTLNPLKTSVLIVLLSKTFHYSSLVSKGASQSVLNKRHVSLTVPML